MSIERLQATDTSTIKWDRDDNSSESIVNGRKEMEIERERASERERERERVKRMRKKDTYNSTTGQI